jgi:hypothetical protein
MRYILALALACACAFGQPRQNSTYIKVVPFGSDPAGNSCTTEGAGALGVYSSGVRVCNGTTWAAVSGGTQIGGYFTSTTGSDSYVMTTSNVATLTNGVYVFTASTSNTGGAQLDWDGVGGASAVPILTEFGSTLVDGMISTTSPNLLYYNGTNFLLMFSSRVIPNATGYQWGRMYSNDGIFWTATFLEGTPSTGPTSITSASNSIDPAGRSYVQVAPTSNIVLTSTPSIAAGTFDGQRLTINNTSASYTLGIKDGSSYGTCLGADQTIAVDGGGLALRWIQDLLCWGFEQTPGSGGSSVYAVNQGFWIGSNDSTSGNLPMGGTSNSMYLQSTYVQGVWDIRSLVVHWNAASTAGAACLYRWGGPGDDDATLIASTTAGSISAAFSHMAITQGTVRIGNEWLIKGFTDNPGTLGIKQSATQVYSNPILAYKVASTGNTDGSCPATVTGINAFPVSSTWSSLGWEWRFGWKY